MGESRVKQGNEMAWTEELYDLWREMELLHASVKLKEISAVSFASYRLKSASCFCCSLPCNRAKLRTDPDMTFLIPQSTVLSCMICIFCGFLIVFLHKRSLNNQIYIYCIFSKKKTKTLTHWMYPVTAISYNPFYPKITAFLAFGELEKPSDTLCCNLNFIKTRECNQYIKE